jgi:hypothetical protein
MRKAWRMKVVVRTVHDAPRFGRTEYQLQDIDRSEPSADLFGAPSDYKVVDAPARDVVIKRQHPQR